ncbi:MAG: hypothetical protein IJ710_05235 [Prevotella sp.]|nr:hypothetical protein [Prevotella sp.]
MKKKSILWSVLAIMMAALVSVGTTSCGSDDDDNGGGANNAVGTWYGTSSSYDEDSELTLTFNADGTGTYVAVYFDSYSDDTDRGTFTYKMTNKDSGVITVRLEDSYDYYTANVPFNINDNTMSVSFDGEHYILRKR